MIAQRQISTQDLQDEQMIMTILADLRAENDEIIDENRQLRNQLADQGEEITSLQAELTRRAEERDRYKNMINWTKDLFANKSIPAACKFVLWHFWLAFFLLRPAQTGEEMRIGVEATASALGISKDTVRKATDKAEAFDLLKRRYEPIELSDGSKMTLAHITLNEACSKPDEIAMEKLQGGKRQKGCRIDGTPLNAYTVRHCPTHGEISVYGQPGNPKEADHTLMIDDFLRFYADRIPTALDHDPRQKQDAFENEQDHVDLAGAAAQLPANRLSVTADQPLVSLASNSIAQKQDAFENSIDLARHILPAPAQLATEHTKREDHGKMLSVIQPKVRTMVCKAVVALNKDGEPARKLEPIVKYRECGSQRWQWSSADGCAVCAECWTPAPLPARIEER